MNTNTLNNKFTLHSDIRLPFEPKGQAIALRESIRNNLKLITPTGYNHIEASLETNEEGFFDVENVLFYNVGVSSFSHLLLDEISFSLIRNQNNHEEKFLYSYELISKQSDYYRQPKMLDFHFQLESMNWEKKPLDIWYAFHKGVIQVYDVNLPMEIGLSIMLELPTKIQNLVSIIKPLIDGIISAFHFQKLVEPFVIEYISAKKSIEENVMISLLDRRAYSLLGERTLISKYRNGIKWNPEDEKCTMVNIKQVLKNQQNVNVSGSAFFIR